jgi:large subunit ribosomal protein L22
MSEEEKLTAKAVGKYIRTSPQKARLVIDQIRGKRVGEAFSILKFSRKSVARDVEKVLRSAVANAEHNFEKKVSTEDLIVSMAAVDQGPSLKRIRPAPMGRAFPIIKRTSYITIYVSEH